MVLLMLYETWNHTAYPPIKPRTGISFKIYVHKCLYTQQCTVNIGHVFRNLSNGQTSERFGRILY